MGYRATMVIIILCTVFCNGSSSGARIALANGFNIWIEKDTVKMIVIASVRT